MTKEKLIVLCYNMDLKVNEHYHENNFFTVKNKETDIVTIINSILDIKKHIQKVAEEKLKLEIIKMLRNE